MLEAVFITNTNLFAYVFTSDLPSSGADTLIVCLYSGFMLFTCIAGDLQGRVSTAAAGVTLWLWTLELQVTA